MAPVLGCSLSFPGWPRAVTVTVQSPHGIVVSWFLSPSALPIQGEWKIDFYTFLQYLPLSNSSVVFCFSVTESTSDISSQQELFLTHFDIQKSDGKFHKLWGQLSRHYGFYTQMGYLLTPWLHSLQAHWKGDLTHFAFEAGSFQNKK